MWTYNPTLADPTDEVRFLVGDTDTNDQLLQNEEIDRLLALFPPATGKLAYLAAAAACDAIAMKFGRAVDRNLGSLSTQNSQKFDHYVQLAKTLREAYQTNGIGEKVKGGYPLAAPVLGGGGGIVLGTAG